MSNRGYWGFLSWKQGRYYTETNYYEDIFSLGSFFHYAEGYSKPAAYDLSIPEDNVVGYLKDLLFPIPRLDFFAVVEARKRKDSPHGKNTIRETPPDDPEDLIEGKRFRPRVVKDPVSKEERFGPWY